ncbi:MAG: hypothetical protein R3E54_10465 [Halioglobus sp.]
MANFLFEHTCEKRSNLGVRIYEKEQIGLNLLTTVEDKVGSTYMKTFLTLSEMWMLDESVIYEVYTIKTLQINRLHSIGPVYEIVSSFSRKSDGVLLSEAVSIRAGLGWLSQALTSGNEVRRCLKTQPGRTGETIGRTSEHATLARRTFIPMTE